MYNKLSSEFVPSENATNGSIGKGMIKYTGKSWNNKELFVGWCDNIEGGVIQFTGLSVAENFEDFRKIFLNDSRNQSFFQDCGVTAQLSFSVRLGQNLSNSQTLHLYEDCVRMQRVKQPKVSIHKENLFIGSRSTGNYICISGGFNPKNTNDQLTDKLLITAKYTLSGATFLNALFHNQNVSIVSMCAKTMADRLSKIVFPTTLELVRNTLIVNNNVGSILLISGDLGKPTTKEGKTVARALSTIRNKLLNRQHFNEASILVTNWLRKLTTDFATDGTFNSFFDGLKSIFGGKQ